MQPPLVRSASGAVAVVLARAGRRAPRRDAPATRRFTLPLLHAAPQSGSAPVLAR
jgi:hypothetical protein